MASAVHPALPHRRPCTRTRRPLRRVLCFGAGGLKAAAPTNSKQEDSLLWHSYNFPASQLHRRTLNRSSAFLICEDQGSLSTQFYQLSTFNFSFLNRTKIQSWILVLKAINLAEAASRIIHLRPQSRTTKTFKKWFNCLFKDHNLVLLRLVTRAFLLYHHFHFKFNMLNAQQRNSFALRLLSTGRSPLVASTRGVMELTFRQT